MARFWFDTMDLPPGVEAVLVKDNSGAFTKIRFQWTDSMQVAELGRQMGFFLAMTGQSLRADVKLEPPEVHVMEDGSNRIDTTKKESSSP